MPTRAPRICGCGRTVASGSVCPCAQARKAEIDAKRPSAAQRGYDSAWRRVRRLFLNAHPMCCKPGCDAPATDVDHVQSVADRPDLRLSWSNLRPFCHAPHSQRTARDQGFARRFPRGEGHNLPQGAGDRLGSSARESEELGFFGIGDE